MLPDYYLILGIPQSATHLEIKAAYRSLAMLHHPDKHGGDPQKNQLFKEINEAYSVLSHSDTKLAYDKQLYWQAVHPEPTESEPSPYSRRPPVYSQPQQPYQYAPRKTPYSTTQYVYSKWTLMYGKIFVVSLIMLVVLFPIMLEYTFSNYYYNKGQVALENENYYQAEIYYRKAMRDLGGSNTIAAVKLAKMKLADDNSFKALSYVKLGLKYAVKTPYRAQLYYMRGIAERNLNHMEEAEIAFEQALILNFNQDSVYKALAPIYAYELRKYDKALASYDSLMQAEPNNIDHYLNRGFCFQKLNQHRTAIADFDYFMENKGINGSVLYLKAISQISLEEIDSACVNFQRSADLGIRNAYTFIKMYCQPDTVKIVYPDNPF